MTFDGKRILAIIPAREGSKGIKRKNLALLNSKPLIEYTIEHALNSEYIDDIVISSDIEGVSELANRHKIDFIERPPNLAQDDTPMKEVVLHILELFYELHKHYDIFALLQPTSPLRKSEDIDKTIEKLVETDSHSCVTICEFEPHPFLSFEVKNDRIQRYVSESVDFTRRQDYPKIYRINGAVYSVFLDKFLEHQEFIIDQQTCFHEMSVENSIDIDTPLDLKIAELIVKKQI